MNGSDPRAAFDALPSVEQLRALAVSELAGGLTDLAKCATLYPFGSPDRARVVVQIAEALDQVEDPVTLRAIVINLLGRVAALEEGP